MKTKSLFDISWQVDEPTYREDSALSYSTLARFAREGFNKLDNLFDKIESPSLTFGSAVDTIITEGYDAFEKKFYIGNFPKLPDSAAKVVKLLADTCPDYTCLEVIPNDLVAQATESVGYNTHWKEETRAKKIKEIGSEYFLELRRAAGKIVLSAELMQKIAATTDALWTSPATSHLFRDLTFQPELERLYQLKFKATFEDVDYRCMADMIIVDHKNKVITPYDLKTSGKPEWDFFKSFIDWSYHIQARLYWKIIRDNMDRDPYFKDFVLKDYQFIVVNGETLTPLVWEYADSHKTETLYYGKNKEIECASPLAYGKRLSKYLKEHPEVPDGISVDRPNDLVLWLNYNM